MLSDDEIDAAILTDYPAAYSLLGGALTAGDFKIALRRVARTVECAAYERAAQECRVICSKNHADAATFKNGTKAYVQACDDCDDAIRALKSKPEGA